MTRGSRETAPHAGTGKFRPYPAYKESGVEWLGEVPAHWEIAPVYARFGVALGKMLDEKRVSGESHGRYLRNVDVQWDSVNSKDLPIMDFLPQERNRYRLIPGDLLVCEGGEVGRTATWQGEIEECFFQKAIHRVRPLSNRDFPRFFYFVMRFLAANGVFVAGSNPNTINHLTAVQLRHFRSLFPPCFEQRAISTFLDRETTKIDALVAKKERLIELLQEKRTTLITRAVTKGLDLDTPMKDSGVKWLGVIPAHWKCLALARATLSRCDGPFGSGLKSQHYSPDGVRVVRLQNIGGPEFLDSDQVFIDETHANSLGDHGILEGDLLIAGLGDDAHPVGRACVAPGGLGRAIVKADCFRFRLHQEQAFPRFVAYQLSAAAYASSGYFVTGSTRLRMNLTTTAARKIALPPIAEQRDIAFDLDREMAKLDALVAKVREAIDRFKELRTALISAAVTGKIDVREISG